MHKANEYFKHNLISLKLYGEIKKSRPVYKSDGAPSKTIAIHQVFEKYNILNGEFPLNNYRPTAIKAAIQEMFWIYRDQSNKLSDAEALGVTWWGDWNIGNGTIGKAYGYTVAEYGLMDNLLRNLEQNLSSRDHFLSLWQQNVITEQKEQGGLVPCAYNTKWNVTETDDVNYIDLTLFQRSQDYITASAINKIQYVAFGMAVCGHLEFQTGKRHVLRNFVPFVDDLHIYDRHIDALNELLEREVSEEQQSISLKTIKNFYDYTIEDFEIIKIKCEPLKSPLEIAV